MNIPIFCFQKFSSIVGYKESILNNLLATVLILADPLRSMTSILLYYFQVFLPVVVYSELIVSFLHGNYFQRSVIQSGIM